MHGLKTYSVSLVLVAMLLSGCARTSFSQGNIDGIRSGQWGLGIPFSSLQFDRERYLTDEEYREAFDIGLTKAQPMMRPWYWTDKSPLVRHILRLDELRAEAEAKAAQQGQP